MIRNMRSYTYTKPSDTLDAYGVYPQTTGGTAMMWISNKSNSPQTTNPLFNNAEYVGLTYSTIPDGSIVAYGNDKLEVLYSINGRVNQVFMKRA